MNLDSKCLIKNANLKLFGQNVIFFVLKNEKYFSFCFEIWDNWTVLFKFKMCSLCYYINVFPGDKAKNEGR